MHNEPIGGWWQSLKVYLGNGSTSWLGALLVFVAAWIIRLIFYFIADNYIAKLTKRTKSDLDDKLLKSAKPPVGNLLLLWGLYGAVYLLDLPTTPYNWRNLAYNILDTLTILTVLWLVLKLIEIVIHFIREGYRTRGEMQYDQLLPFVRDVMKILAIVGGVVWIIIAWDKDPSVLLAGLGIGGLAIGFAAKDTIANIFGSITIFADRPFDVGDWVIIGDTEGVIEEVGFRTTKIRTFEKTLITIPNSLIANTTINNFSRMPLRRVKQRIGILYETPIDKVRQVVQGMRQLLIDHPQVAEDPLLVNFEDFADSSLTIFVYYFTVTTKWAEYLSVREEINLKFMELFENLGVEFAYPTRTLWHRGDLGLGGLPRLSDGDFEEGI